MADRNETDEIRARVSILDVVSPYVNLKRAGAVYKGLCPFHQERTPSFQVNPDRGRWHCFGQCSEGGDIFKFLQKIENLSFPEALERLALRAGVTLAPTSGAYSRSSATDSASRAGERDRLYAAVAWAVNYYRQTLAQSDGATNYLSARGVTPETAQAFAIGFGGEDWTGLSRYLQHEGVSAGDAVAAGLVMRSERGDLIDKLRARLIFPIFDVQDRPIAFGGRLLESVEGRPKYLNSAESKLFYKGKTLYALNRARKAIAEQESAIVVEGYLDVIACHQAGFTNVVATLGTSLTEDHARLLARLAHKIVLSFDADAAGIKAAQRATAMFADENVEVRMISLPAGEDPDSLINSGRSDEFAHAIQSALPVVEHRLKQIVDSVLRDSTADEQERVVVLRREVYPLLKGVPDAVERERYIGMAARLHPKYATGSAIAEDQIRHEVQLASNTGFRRDRAVVSQASKSPLQVVSGAQICEEIIIDALISAKPDVVEVARNELNLDDFVSLPHRRLADFLRTGARPMAGDLDPDTELLYSKLSMKEEHGDATSNMRAVRDAITRLRRNREDVWASELKEKATLGDPGAVREYYEWVQSRKGAQVDADA